MRPSYEVHDVGTFREITIWKAVVLGVLTLGIYLLVVTYQNTRDLQEAREVPFSAWPILFWIGVVPFLGIVHYILYAFNGMAYKGLRDRQGLRDDSLWIVALVLSIVLAPVGQIIWAATFNGWLRENGTPRGVPERPAVYPAA